MTKNENGFGVILSLADLRAKLRTISSAPHRWTAKLVDTEPAEEGWTTVYAEIWYSNPTLIDMPNEICYRFPAFRDPCWGDADAFVCLHPSLIVAVQEGLYFEEDDRLLWDPLEDFFSFWRPIREALS